MPLGWVAGATALAGVVGAVGASNAASDQAQSSANAQAISQQQYQDTVNRNAPYTNAGYGALSQLDYLLGVNPQTAGGGAPNAPASSGGVPQSATGGYSQYNSPSLFGGASNGFGPLTTGRPATGAVGAPGPGGLGYSGLTGASASGSGAVIPGGTGQVGGSGVPVSGASAGSTAGGYGSLLKSFDTSDWKSLSPAYNFQLQQGQQGVMNANASGQGALSGAAYKDLIDYNQNAANTSFNSAFNQYQTQQGNIYSRLSGIAQLGQASANNTGQQGTALAGQAAQSATNIGTAQAGGDVGVAKALGGAAASAAPWLQYGGGGGNGAAAWDTENPNNFQDFQSSDRRLKTDIRLVGKLDSGLNIYTFKYSASPDITHMGVMADEVQKIIPTAVSTDENGYLQVRYGMVR